MKPIRLLAIVAILGLAATSIRLAQDHAADQGDIADLTARLADADKAAKAADAKTKLLQNELAQAGNGPTAAPDQNPAATNSAAPPKKNPMAQVAEMMKNPAMRDMVAAQQKQAVETNFGDLIKRFNLSPAERDQFVKLLTDRQLNQMDIGLKLMGGGNLTPDDRAALAQQIKDANATSDAQIQQFLNDDADYAYYQTYVQQQPERMQLTTLDNQLTKAGIPLDPSQTDNLASVMYDARKNFKFTTDFADPSAAASLGPDSLTDQSVQTYEQQQEQLDSQIAQQVAPLLTPDQLDIFKQNQAQMRQLTQMGLNMSRQMLGGGK